VKFHPDPILNDGTGHPSKKMNKNKMCSDMRSVPDLKIVTEAFDEQ